MESKVRALLTTIPASKELDELQDAFEALAAENHRLRDVIMRLRFRAHMHDDQHGFDLATEALNA